MKFTREQYARALYGIFFGSKESNVKSFAKKFALLLRRNGDLKQAREILERFSRYADEKDGRQRVEVASARKLGEQEKKAIAKVVSEMTQKKVELRETVDPALLGGMKVKVGDEVFDFTLRRRLRSFSFK